MSPIWFPITFIAGVGVGLLLRRIRWTRTPEFDSLADALRYLVRPDRKRRRK